MFAILAHDDTNGIGNFDGLIPWYSHEDMAFFKKMTAGKHMIMGANTLRPLLKKANVAGNWLFPGRKVDCPINRFDDELSELAATHQNISILYNPTGKFTSYYVDGVVAGGSKTYLDHFDQCQQFVITQIKGNYECDVKVSELIAKVRSECIMVESRELSETAFATLWVKKAFLKENNGDAGMTIYC